MVTVKGYNPPDFQVRSQYVCENGTLGCEAKLCEPDIPNETNCYCTKCGGVCGECQGNACGIGVNGELNFCGGNMSCEDHYSYCDPNVSTDCTCHPIEEACPYQVNICWKPEELTFPGACVGAEAK